MNTLYWITVLGNLNITLILVSALLFIILLMSFVVFIVNLDKYGDKYTKAFAGKTMKYASIAFILTVIIQVFLPSKTDLYLIYGVGGTMDYLKENPTAKQLPDKCIKAIDKWCDNINEEKDGENK